MLLETLLGFETLGTDVAGEGLLSSVRNLPVLVQLLVGVEDETAVTTVQHVFLSSPPPIVHHHELAISTPSTVYKRHLAAMLLLHVHLEDCSRSEVHVTSGTRPLTSLPNLGEVLVKDALGGLLATVDHLMVLRQVLLPCENFFTESTDRVSSWFMRSLVALEVVGTLEALVADVAEVGRRVVDLQVPLEEL